MPSPTLVIRGAMRRGAPVDLLVAEGLVLELAPHDPARAFDCEIIDAAGLVLLAGLVDCHTHLRDPGYEYKEDIASGLAAAAKGGFCRIFCMANTKPVNDDAPITRHMLLAAAESFPHGPRLHPVGALTRGLDGKELSPMADLAEAGCAAFSNDGLPVASAEIFRRAVEYAATFGKVVIDHCEEPSLAPAAGVNEGSVSGRLGLKGQPDVAEAMQVARDVLLAEYLDLPIHLAHVSCEKSAALIRFAKSRGVKISAETCPHYLTLTEEAVEGYDTLAKVNPPLRTAADVAAMRAALADGTIDALATDHAPHAAHEKEVEFDQAPCGITGLDTALAVTWSLVREGALSEEAFERAWHVRPCEIFGLPANRFEPGDPADFILLDASAEWVVTAASLASKSKNTPLLGSTLTGRCALNCVGGVPVHRRQD